MEQHLNWGGPGKHVANQEGLHAKPFEAMVAGVKPDYVKELSRHSEVLKALKEAGWPTEEAACDVVGDKVGYGAAEMAAVSLYQRSLTEGNRDTVH